MEKRGISSKYFPHVCGILTPAVPTPAVPTPAVPTPAVPIVVVPPTTVGSPSPPKTADTACLKEAHVSPEAGEKADIISFLCGEVAAIRKENAELKKYLVTIIEKLDRAAHSINPPSANARKPKVSIEWLSATTQGKCEDRAKGVDCCEEVHKVNYIKDGTEVTYMQCRNHWEYHNKKKADAKSKKCVEF